MHSLQALILTSLHPLSLVSVPPSLAARVPSSLEMEPLSLLRPVFYPLFPGKSCRLLWFRSLAIVSLFRHIINGMLRTRTKIINKAPDDVAICIIYVVG